jgi:hypothetical protein
MGDSRWHKQVLIWSSEGGTNKRKIRNDEIKGREKSDEAEERNT